MRFEDDRHLGYSPGVNAPDRQPATTYRSAVDTWLWVVLGGAIGVILLTCGMLLVAGDGRALAIGVVAALVGGGLPIWILASTSYTLSPTDLVIRSGPFRWRRPIAGITAITPTRNPLSSPALSLDRLRVESRGHGAIMISPADRAGFLADLEARRAAAAGAGR
jgi:hypothetical protein